MTKKRDADEVVLSCTTCRTVSENVAPCNTRPEYPRTLVVPPEMLRTAVGLPPRRSTAHAVLNIGPPQSLTVNKGKCWDKDPGIPGPYGSCIFSEPYIAVWSKDGLTPLPAQIYIPGFNLNGLCIPSGDGKFPLVLIYHARGIAGQSPPTNHLGYDKLARHLASHGFIVASVNRGDGQPWLDSGELIEDHIDTLFNVYSTTKDRLQGGVALIGHSSGGTMVIRHAGRVRSPKNPAHKARNLAALVLFAPVLPSPFGEAEASLLASSTDAFLGLQAYNDEDSGAFGDKQVDQPMEVVFGVFDGFGNLPLNPHLSAALKDMVFASGETVPDHNFPLTHYFQNTVFALAYTTAFLHRNLNFNGAYDKYLREQVMPESIQKFYPPAYKFWQQHEDRARLVVANFTDPLGTIVSHSDFGISTGISSKHFCWIHGANHTAFMDGNFEGDPIVFDDKTRINRYTQRMICWNYITTFFRLHLNSESQFRPLFVGDGSFSFSQDKRMEVQDDIQNGRLNVFMRYDSSQGISLSLPTKIQFFAMHQKGVLISGANPAKFEALKFLDPSTSTPQLTLGFIVGWGVTFKFPKIIVPCLPGIIPPTAKFIEFQGTLVGTPKVGISLPTHVLHTVEGETFKSQAVNVTIPSPLVIKDPSIPGQWTRSTLTTIRIPISVWDVSDAASITGLILDFGKCSSTSGEIALTGFRATFF